MKILTFLAFAKKLIMTRKSHSFGESRVNSSAR